MIYVNNKQITKTALDGAETQRDGVTSATRIVRRAPANTDQNDVI